MSERLDLFSSFMTNLRRNPRHNFKSYLKKFVSLSSNLDRVNFVYKDFMGKHPNLLPFVKDVKSDVAAVKKRQEGNIFFKNESYRHALDCYTISISLANSNEVLAMAYANRSAALFRLDLHADCLEDIVRAFQHGYPKEFKKKLIKRREQCQKGPKAKNYEPLPVIPDNEKNPLIQCASNCVDMVYKEQYGRCVVATRDIEVGEILAVEPLYAAVIKDEFYVHCHHCFELCYSLIPCKNCTKALYCSENCRDGAFATYHKYECPILLSLDSIMIDYPKRLALKMTLIAKEEMQPSKDHTLKKNEVYRSDRFKEVFNMETHLKERKPENLLARTVVAAALFHLIKTRTTFLQDGVDEDRLKEFLLTLILVCSLNTVELNELSRQSIAMDLSSVATAVYSFYTIFSHSCVHNVMRQFHGSTMVMRSLYTIKKGEQCFVLYGPNYKEYPKSWRQNFLAEHQFFTCKCQACEENWPMDMGSAQREYSLPFALLLLELTHSADVDTAKKILPNLLAQARYLQRFVSFDAYYEVRQAIWICYNTLGNVRRI